MKGIPWGRNQDEALAAGWRNPRLTREEIAEVLGVTFQAVCGRARKLDLGQKAFAPPPRLLSIVNGAARFLIPGAGGRIVILDEADAEWFVFYPGGWFAHSEGGNCYVYTRGRPRKKLHRLLIGCRATALVDHRNRGGLDNRRENIREATSAQNVHNSGRNHRARSQYRGVWLHGPDGLFHSAVKCPDGKRRSVGYYRTEREAARARDAVVHRLHGEFAYLNFPDSLLSDAEIANNRNVLAILQWLSSYQLDQQESAAA